MALTTLLIIAFVFLTLIFAAKVFAKIIKFAMGVALIGILVFSAVFFIQNDSLPGFADITGAVTSIDVVNDTIEDSKEFADDKKEELITKTTQTISDVMNETLDSIPPAPSITIK